MDTLAHIKTYIDCLLEPKRAGVQALHARVLYLKPGCRLWFLDGRDSAGRVVSNPNIGYGQQSMALAGGKTREFYQVSISANTTGISVYIMGLKDKKFLVNTYGKTLGKASITGYCIKFKHLIDIRLDVLDAALRLALS